MVKYAQATCIHCSKATDISLSHDFRRLLAHNKTLSEQLTLNEKRLRLIHNMKNAENIALHKMISELWRRVPEGEKEEIYNKQQELRDTLTKIKRKYS